MFLPPGAKPELLQDNPVQLSDNEQDSAHLNDAVTEIAQTDDRVQRQSSPMVDEEATAPPAKKKKSSKQSRTLQALTELGTGNKSMGEALKASTKQEAQRMSIDERILHELESANFDKEREALYQRQCTAAEVIAGIPEFESFSDDDQFAVQEWLWEGTHAQDFLKVIPNLRWRWLKKQTEDLRKRMQHRKHHEE